MQVVISILHPSIHAISSKYLRFVAQARGRKNQLNSSALTGDIVGPIWLPFS